MILDYIIDEIIHPVWKTYFFGKKDRIIDIYKLELEKNSEFVFKITLRPQYANEINRMYEGVTNAILYDLQEFFRSTPYNISHKYISDITDGEYFIGGIWQGTNNVSFEEVVTLARVYK